MKREETLARIRENPEVSVLIIGGGINGLGTFRDLTLQGIDVLLVERADFCSGASAASSHMVHGGIRYLENGEFRLVNEAVKERNRLIENAPHYVRPLPTTIPIFKRFSGMLNAPLKFLGLLDRPGERGALVIKMGLIMYDRYTADQGTVPKHTFLGRQESLQEYPKLNPDIINTATYYDGAMPSPERIAIEVMLDGLEAGEHAQALNYVSAVDADGDTVTLRDELTGADLTVQPKLVINAAGPWIDFANQRLGLDTKMIGGTKGSHIVLDHPELYEATKEHEFFFENDDGRIVLIFPVAKDRLIVGTTDIPIDDPDQARCTEEEIDYFFDFIKFIFPDIAVDRSQIVYQFSGVRPLPASDAKTAGQISRDHENRIVEPSAGLNFPIFNLIGGKWTSFRAFSEHVADDALARLGRSRKLDTRHRPIGGGRDYPSSEAAQTAWVEATAQATGVPATRIRELFDRYGTRAQSVAEYIAQGEDRPLAGKPDYSVREIEFITQDEHVVHLGDFFQRRSLLAMMGHLSHPLVVEVAAVIGRTLGWSDAQRQQEVDDFLALLAEQHGVGLKADTGESVTTD
ncbi:MAG: glycerol-3-phosphate dehydrogenase/oxidase [Candidatus Promineifilaceae bacterium]|nr:glycerol-3-phosphate dehydrogenase/oxidase [Candidatus Promineifilaceae bacterium]